MDIREAMLKKTLRALPVLALMTGLIPLFRFYHKAFDEYLAESHPAETPQPDASWVKLDRTQRSVRGIPGAQGVEMQMSRPLEHLESAGPLEPKDARVVHARERP